jgi:hypothetical protein
MSFSAVAENGLSLDGGSAAQLTPLFTSLQIIIDKENIT